MSIASLRIFLDGAERLEGLPRRRKRSHGSLLADPRRTTRGRRRVLPKGPLVQLRVDLCVHVATPTLGVHRRDAHLPDAGAAPTRPRSSRQRLASPHRHGRHVGAREGPPEHRLGEHEVYLAGTEQLAAAERRHVLVEVERVGAAQEERVARIACAEDVGDADRRGGGELRQRAVGGDDAGRRRLLLGRDAAPVVVRET
uniref:Uncharacterized protein n=1 Tax=Triticum urartu TaxID=4572 RepID=A0A8R7V6Y9_TRIUA